MLTMIPRVLSPKRSILSLAVLFLCLSGMVAAVLAHGGWIEPQGTALRERWSPLFVQSFMPPSRGAFTFPPPYNTQAVRITDASDCGGKDCVWYVGYSYWRNTNAHEGNNEILIFLGLDQNRGGSGPTLFRYNKLTNQITKVGPLFPPNSKFNHYSPNDWYFSPSLPTKLYLGDGPKMLRYDVLSQTFETVFDLSSTFGPNRNVWQMHSSNDDLVHSATLQVADTGEYLGCLVFLERQRQFRFYPKIGVFDECNLDRSGRWTVSLEDIGVPKDIANRIFDNETGKETRLRGPQGTLGHLDMGFGYMLGADDEHPLPNATIRWDFEPRIAQGPLLHHNSTWGVVAINHPSHVNAKPDVPKSQQYACGSNVTQKAIQNEITCIRLDGSNEQLIVAPVMTDLNATGGGKDDFYAKYPKGNLDITGQYFIWTSNLGGDRMDAFMVKVPAQLLIRADSPPVTMTTPHDR